MRIPCSARRLSVAVLALLTVVVALPLLLPNEPGTVHARKYHYHKRHYSYGAQIAKCKGYCNTKAGIERGCAKNAAKSGLKACIKMFKAARGDCAGDGGCKREAATSLQQCKAEVRHQLQVDLRAINGRGYGAPACTKCCQKSHGGGSCTNYLSSSRWYNSYKSYKHLRCVASASGAFLPGVTDVVRSWLAQLVPFLVRGWSS